MNEKLGWIKNIVLMGVFYAVARLFGLSGIGAVVLGWFVFNRLNKKNQWYISLIAGIVSGLAGYVLLTFVVLTFLG